jgi:hypothetical protein
VQKAKAGAEVGGSGILTDRTQYETASACAWQVEYPAAPRNVLHPTDETWLWR